MGRITTHVLDTANGKPGQGISLQLYFIQQGAQQAQRVLRCATHTNADGRCDQALIEAEHLDVGVYEIDFSVGAYFAKMGHELPTPNFLDRITLRFGVADGAAHYHVPLLVTPWSYSTYRGS